jgi:hypothetical protein
MIFANAVETQLRPNGNVAELFESGVPTGNDTGTLQSFTKTYLTNCKHKVIAVHESGLTRCSQIEIAAKGRLSHKASVAKRLRPAWRIYSASSADILNSVEAIHGRQLHNDSTKNNHIKENNGAGGLMKFIEIEIRHFAKYIKRGDIKTPNWFAVDHNILLHPDFFPVSGDEFKAYVWIIGVAAHLNASKIRVYPEVCASQLRIPVEVVHSSIEKLNEKRWDVTNPLRRRTGNNKASCPTVQDSTIQNITNRETNTAIAAVFDFDFVYNLYPKKLGKSQGLKTFNRTIKTTTDYDRLVLAVQNYAAHVDAEKTEPKFIKHFSTFMNQWSDWIEYKAPEAVPSADLSDIPWDKEPA